MIWLRRAAGVSSLAAGCAAASRLLLADCEGSPSFDLSLLADEHYKAHFTSAYNAASRRHQAPAQASAHGAPEAAVAQDAAQLRVRQGIARHLMGKLGYSPQEVALLNEDVTRTQGTQAPPGRAPFQAEPQMPTKHRRMTVASKVL